MTETPVLSVRPMVDRDAVTVRADWVDASLAYQVTGPVIEQYRGDLADAVRKQMLELALTGPHGSHARRASLADADWTPVRDAFRRPLTFDQRLAEALADAERAKRPREAAP